MRWRNHGLIFRLNEHSFGDNEYCFAQSPQVLIFDQKIRVYFSTRTLCANSKYFSTIKFVEFGKSFDNLLRVSYHQIIPNGELGTFDEHGIFPMHVHRIGNCIYGYTCGWSRRSSVDIDMAIGLVKSVDEGMTFSRLGLGPILGPTLHEPCMIGDPFVLSNNGIFHMWYIFGSEWKFYPGSSKPERIYKIAHALSLNGLHWIKPDEGKSIISTKLGDDECQALPSIHYFLGRYNMVFCYRYASNFRSDPTRGYRLGYAYSYDLINWSRDDYALNLPPSKDGWDTNMQCYPHLFSWKGEVYLLYNGNNFGKDGFGLCQLEFPSLSEKS